MSLPVSQYEELLAEVRCLRRKAQRVQQLATPLISNCSSAGPIKTLPPTQKNDEVKSRSSSSCYYKMEPLLTGRHHNNVSSNQCEFAASSSADGDTTCSEDEWGGGARSTHLSVSSEPITHGDRGGPSALYHGTWPAERTMWNSEPTPRRTTPSHHHHNTHMDVASVMSFASSAGGMPMGSPSMSRRSSQQQLEAKVDMVYSLLAMLSGQEHADMGETLLALSANPESCLAMRQSGCVPLLVQMVQSDREPEARKKASLALYNLVHSQSDEKTRKREVRIFKLLEHARAYTEALGKNAEFEAEVTSSSDEDDDRHPVQTVAHLMKLSFDELHRQAICTLGGIHTIANLVEVEHVKHGSTADEAHCVLMRRYACMALTNLTFGDSGNKALLCSFREFMRALVVQLQSPSDELRQVTASVLRNLSWRADSSSKEILREVGSVSGLMKAAMLDNKENTLKSILSALWNLSAHCTENKSEICSVEGALGFLVDMLTYKTPSKSLAIIENSGGILRNISSQIAVRDDYREILRRHNCLQILLEQLKSPSLTIVSNACGTLWNLSAKCSLDQEALWQMGAPSMLRSLNHSKHKMIAMGSSAALKNLLSARPAQPVPAPMDSTALAMDLPALPTLGARKQKALMQELDQSLSETYENIEKDSPVKVQKYDFVHAKGVSRGLNDGEVSFETEFSSLNYSEPSTSYDSKFNFSLPHMEINKIEDENCERKCFVKCRPKSVAKSSKSSDSENKSFNVYNDSGLQSLESPRFDTEEEPRCSLDTFSNSIDNDKFKRSDSKLKEVSVYSDEKDHCSIEDVSDSDNQSSLDLEQKLNHDDSSFLLSSGLVVRKDVNHSSNVSTPSLPLPKYGNIASSNVTMFEGDIDEIDMEDISINFASENEHNDAETEKQDVEKENFTDFIGINTENSSVNIKPITTKIPLPRSLPKPIPVSNTNIHGNDVTVDPSSSFDTWRQSRSNLPRKSLQTSTPIRINSRNETSKVQNIDVVASPVCLEDVVCTLPPVDPTISQENDAKAETEDKATDDCYGSCVNFSIEDADRDRLLERSCEESNPVDNRMLDPDAMIESLDRFTAELVSQASHLQQSNVEDKYKDNTWNEDTSPNEVTFPSISGSAPNVVTFDSNDSSEAVVNPEPIREQSNDFSSVNTTNTMTESTLIHMEAIKMATVFRNEAEMSHSISSVASLELDKVQPPSLLLDSSSVTEVVKSSKLQGRKRSLPKSLMVKRALSNSMNNGSSLESLSNLDQMNPPSAMGEILDMDGSITSVASLPSETNNPEQVGTDFVIDGAINKNNSLLGSKPTNFFTNNCQPNSVSDLENINPPSIFNEITDLCNSLADVPTEAIGSETEIFEDCRTHVVQTEDDVTELFSDANSATPIQSDLASSSPEVSPKKNKALATRQRRNLARDRYMTYTVAAPEVHRSASEEFKTADCGSAEDRTTYESLTYSVKTSRLTPKERRQNDRSRFETRVVEETVTDILQQPVVGDGPQASPSRSRLSIRRNFMQKRLENKDRFKTQILSESTFSQEVVKSPEAIDLRLLVQKEANLVLKSLRETKTSNEELLDCETLSLVSNDDDSEVNSSSPINYRTYHKSWGLKKNVPVIEPVNKIIEQEEQKLPAKPKIVKPTEEEEIREEQEEEEEPPQGKAIRGRRKPLYSKSTIGNKIAPKTLKPIKSMTSNIVKNVTSSIKSVKQSTSKTVTKLPPVPQPKVSKLNSPKTATKAKLERQGTFTKEEPVAGKSKIPTPGTAAAARPSKIPAKNKPMAAKSSAGTASDGTNKNSRLIYGRSTSADSRDAAANRRIQSSVSSQSLKNERAPPRKSSIPQKQTQKTGSSSSLNSTGSSAKKQVTSKIASLWKKIEESKSKQPTKKDTRVWIGQGEGGSEGSDNKEGVTLRSKRQEGGDVQKRVSRLGSFIVMDETEDGARLQRVVNAAADE